MPLLLLPIRRTLSRLSELSTPSQLADVVATEPCALAHVTLAPALAGVRPDLAWLHRTGTFDRAGMVVLSTPRDAGSRNAGTLDWDKLDGYLDIPPTRAEFGYLRIHRQVSIPESVRAELAELVRDGAVSTVERAVTYVGDHRTILVLTPAMPAITVSRGWSSKVTAILGHAPAAPRPSPHRPRKDQELLGTFQSYCAGIRAAGDSLLEAAGALDRAVPGAGFGLIEARLFRERVEAIARRPLQVALLGQFSSGKSSLINAFLGVPLLAASDLPTTATVHRIRYGVEASTTVRFKSRDDLAQDVHELIASAVTPEQAAAIMATPRRGEDVLLAALNALRKVIEEAEIAGRRSKELTLLSESYLPLVSAELKFREDLGATRSFSKEQLRADLLGERATVAVAEVMIHADVPLLASGLELVDLPGISSTFRRHTQLALQVIKRADVVIFLHSAQQPFGREDGETLRTLLAERRDEQGVQTVIQVVNKIDASSNPSEVIDEIRRKVRETCGVDGDPIPVSGRLGLCARASLRPDGEPLDNIDQVYYKEKRLNGFTHLDWLEMSSVMQVEQEVDRTVESQRIPLMRKDVGRCWDEFVDDALRACEDQKRIWDSESTERLVKIERLVATSHRFRVKQQDLKRGILAGTRTAGERAVATLRHALADRRVGLIQDYREHFGNLAGFMGSARALNFLNGEVIDTFRTLFQDHLETHAEVAVMLLNEDLDALLVEVQAFVTQLDEENDAIIYGIGPRRSRKRRAINVGAFLSTSETGDDGPLTVNNLRDRVLLSIDFGGTFGQRLLVDALNHAADQLTAEVGERIQAMVAAHALEVERDASLRLDRCVDLAVAKAEGLRQQLTDFTKLSGDWRAALAAFESAVDRADAELRA